MFVCWAFGCHQSCFVCRSVLTFVFLHGCFSCIASVTDEDVASATHPPISDQRLQNNLDRLILEKQAHHSAFVKQMLERFSLSKNDQLATAQESAELTPTDFHEISKSLLQLLHHREVAIVDLVDLSQHEQRTVHVPLTSDSCFDTSPFFEPVINVAGPSKR